MKHLLIIFSILLLSFPLFGDNHKGETLYRWGECCEDYKWMGFGDKETQPKYQGQVKDEKPNGLGFMTYPNGVKYLGSWKDGENNGEGTMTYSDGSKYVGEWKNGKRNGQGTFTFPNGNKGIGEFRENKPWNITEYDKYGNIIGKFMNGWFDQ